MTAFIKFLDGYKTYIVSFIVFVYAILALAEVAPAPDQLADWGIIIAAYMATLRSVFSKIIETLKEK